MAKIYSSDNITLNVENMRKKEHFFYENGKDELIGQITIERAEECIKLFFYEKLNDKLYKSMASCYNKFINDNQRFSHYELGLGQPHENTEGMTNDFPFVVYAIKKDLNAPINLITKEQMDELDKNKISYYNYYTENSIKGLSLHNKNILMDLSNSLNFTSNDLFKDYILNVYLSNQKKYCMNHKDMNVPLTILEDHDSDKIDKNGFIHLPEVNVLDRDKNGYMKEIPSSEKDNNLIIEHEVSKLPLNLSDIKQKNIRLDTFINKENLLKTVETLSDKDSKTISLNTFYAQRLEIPHDICYQYNELKCNELINCLSEKIIKYTANRDNGLK